MKFTNGQWALREGVSLISPRQVRDIRRSGSSVILYAPVTAVAKRDDTLNLPQLTIEFDAPMPDVIRVVIYHFKGGLDRGPHFALQREEGFAAGITESDDELTVESGRLQATVRKNGTWGIAFSFDGRPLTRSSADDIAYVRDADGRHYTRERLSLGVGEYVYGLGERFAAFVKNGQSIEMWNEDGGTSSDIAYKNIPFYLTNRGYGVLVNHPEKVSFEVASEAVSKVQFSVPGERLEYLLVGGESPKDVLRRYTQLAGRPALPPAWSFGLWLTTSFTTDYDEATVSGFVNGMRERDIPLHVFHFDCFWMKEFQWCDFEWDRDQFPDPKGFISRLKSGGLRVCVWINPYIAQKSRLFDEGCAGGFLVKRADGGVFQWDKWQAGMALVDLTNPRAVEWYKERLRALLRIGVDCFKTDFGERIPVDVVYADGSDPLRMHNYYSYLYNKTVFELLQEEKGPNGAVLFARSASVGGQKYPVHWGGDSSATYESMAESLRGGLSLGLSGFGFWSHDIGGFEKTATPDLYKRWTAFGLLSSHSRLHGYDSYRVPWLFDEEAVQVLRAFVRLKCRLMPYLYAVSCEAAAEGVPVMRAMVLEFPDDPACAYLDRQYMLGPSLLCAPIMEPGGTVRYYVPAGRWTDFLTGDVRQGGCWRTENHSYLDLPMLVRPGALIPVGACDTRVEYDYAENVTWHAFEIRDGAHVNAAIHADGGATSCSVTVERKGREITARAEGARTPWSLLLRGVPSVRGVTGGAATSTPLGTDIHASAGGAAVHVLLEGKAD